VIIGEIRDEHEPSTDVIEDGKGGYIVSGNFDLDRVSDLLDTFHARPGGRDGAAGRRPAGR